MSKHTPPPWDKMPRHECLPICRQDEAGLSIGFVHSSDPERQAEGLANCFLIVAAPEMYVALQNLVLLYEADDGCRQMPEYVAAIAALKRAKP